MMESLDGKTAIYKKPNFRLEAGEFDRVASTFGLDSSVLLFLAEDTGKMVELSNDLWSLLDNTDSFDIAEGDWQTVDAYATTQDVPRNWQELRVADTLDAPIIMKYKSRYHLVAGNTRLMVAKAKGITPQVWLFEVYEN